MGKPEDNKEVDFHFYCPLCVNCDKSEGLEPCCSCLDTPVRVGTEKPIKFVVLDKFEGKIEEKYGRKKERKDG